MDKVLLAIFIVVVGSVIISIVLNVIMAKKDNQGCRLKVKDNDNGNTKQAIIEFADKLIYLYDNDEDNISDKTPCKVVVQNIKDIRDELLKEFGGNDD